MDNKRIPETIAGDNVGLSLKNVSFKQVKRGDIFGSCNIQPPVLIGSFVAQIIVVNHPGKIAEGYSPIAKCNQASIVCKMVKFLQKIDRRCGRVME